MNHVSRLALLAVLNFLPGALLAQQATLRPVTIDDAFKIREVKDPQLSPDAKWLAYTVTAASLKEDDNKSRIWMVPITNSGAATSEPIALTSEAESSTHPRWSPDGKFMAFLSARKDGKQQVWLLNRLGGEAEKLTDTIQDVEDFLWSPEGRRLALVLRDPSPEELEEAKDKAKDKDEDSAEKVKKKKADKPWVIDRLQFKEDTRGYLDRRRTHIYVFDLAAKSLRQITGGDFDDDEAAWSPDGQAIAFTSNRSVPDPDATYNTDIWVVAADNADKGANLKKISSSPGEDHSPAWSPDGKSIAFTTQLDPKLFQYATKQLAIAPVTGGEVKVLTQSFDRMVTSPHFSPDGNSLYFIADDDGTQNLCRIATTGGEVTRPIGGRLMVYDYNLAKSGEVAAHISKIDHPDEIYFLPASSSATPASPAEPARITHVNDPVMQQLRLASAEYVHFKSKDGTQVSGYLYKPPDYVPGKRVPTLLRPHGGPVWAWYAEFNFVEQLFAANGYAVLLPNPRGSSGYGEKYCKAIFADWGNKDFQDDMAFVDYAIEQGIADADRLGVGGWSYGGISTDFIIGQTQRFKAAISGAGEALNISNYGHDQYQRDYETELGRPWENEALWDRLSPFYNVKNITTPVLFMGGDADSNVPILGGEQMYQALKSLGRPTELVVYPGEFHEFTTPSHIEDRLRRFLAWYNHYIKGDSSPATPPLTPAK
ncbi:MAG: S9 family peptidase [Candidatus Acidiferrum sp.]|jgi:dipeptidyl aminopeptidase/acylaminoacyl peptidase